MASEPDWKLALRHAIGEQIDPWTDFRFVEDAVFDAVMPHIDAAYQRGLMAGRSQANYPTRRKKKESE